MLSDGRYVLAGGGSVTDVFLSYKAEDRSRLAPLVEALEANGLSVWWDAQIGGGDRWRETIERQLTAARCVIVAWSKRSVGPEGHFVRDEAARAQRLGTYVPVRIDKVEPPLGFGETQALSLQGWKGDRTDPHYLALLESVRNRVGKTALGEIAPSQAAGVTRRSALIAGSAAAASIVGLGAWWWTRSSEHSDNDSIAVLPFANLSNDPAQAYFSDGIAEELRSALSRIARLKVVARTSSEAVRDADAKTAARKLGVGNILTGSVRRTATTLRISAQLVDGREGIEQWSQVYDRPIGDSLQIQSDIAERVANALKIALAKSPDEFRAQGGTNSAEAQDLLLRSADARRRGDSEQAVREALGLIEAAIAIDPRYGDAWATKSTVLNDLSGAYAQTAAEARALANQAERAALHAIQIAPQSQRGYVALGNVYYYALRIRAGLAQLEKARAIPSEDTAALTAIAYALSETGRTADALALTDQVIATDPLNAAGFHAKAVILSDAGRLPEAEQFERKAIAILPNRAASRNRLALILMLQGKTDEARAELAAIPSDNVIRITYEAVLDARTGNRVSAERALTQLRLMGDDSSQFQQAAILAQLGDRDGAIAALQKGWKYRDSGLTGMRSDPLLEPVRSDPRFVAILKRMNA